MVRGIGKNVKLWFYNGLCVPSECMGGQPLRPTYYNTLSQLNFNKNRLKLCDISSFPAINMVIVVATNN